MEDPTEHGLARGRISHLHLTDAGVALYRRLIPQVTAIVESADLRLTSEEQAQLTEQLNVLVRGIPDLR